MNLPWPILCSECHKQTGAWFVDGDPYLPFIVCSECVAEHKDRAESEIPK